MTNEPAKELTVVDAPIEWRSRDEVDALAKRFQVMLPGKLNRDQALALAQYSAALDANPFRGEVYAFESRGKLVLDEGYKLLVRWARRQCNFSDRYERVRGEESVAEDAIAFRCHILRDDAQGTLKALTEVGASWAEAFSIAAQSAVGVVTRDDMFNRQNQPIPPPKGWTWEQVARKRALKNALNLAYGAPSPREIARESWTVDDVVTVPEDWSDDPDMLPIERELAAAANAKDRQRQPCEVDAATAYGELFDNDLPAQESEGDDGDNGEHEIVEAEEVTVKKEKPKSEKGGNNKSPHTVFWAAAKQVGMTRDDGLRLLAECKDDFEKALEQLRQEFPA